jgi:hypothetical protein
VKISLIPFHPSRLRGPGRGILSTCSSRTCPGRPNLPVTDTTANRTALNRPKDRPIPSEDRWMRVIAHAFKLVRSSATHLRPRVQLMGIGSGLQLIG